MATTIIVKRAAGNHEGRAGEFIEESDGSLWFQPYRELIHARDRAVAVTLMREHPDTIGEWDEEDWRAGGDGWVYK